MPWAPGANLVRRDGTLTASRTLYILNRTDAFQAVVRSFHGDQAAERAYEQRLADIRTQAAQFADFWSPEQRRVFNKLVREEQADIKGKCALGEAPSIVIATLPRVEDFLPRELCHWNRPSTATNSAAPQNAATTFHDDQFPTPWTGSFRYTDPSTGEERVVDYPASSGLVPRHDSTQRSLEKGRPASRIASRTALHHGLNKKRWEDQWKRELSR
ncbi:hypothetical protein JCM8547_002161 [Rhodosporidiobolus lusitaniae]